MLKLPRLPFDLLIGNFSFSSDGLPSPSMLPGVFPYVKFYIPTQIEKRMQLKTKIISQWNWKLTEASAMPFGEAMAKGL